MNPNQTLESAAHYFLTNLETPLTLVASSSIYKGVDNPLEVDSDESSDDRETRVHPSVSMIAEGTHEEAVFNSRIFQGMLAVMVEANAFTTTDTSFAAICDQVFSKFNILELEANMSAGTADFRLIQAHVVGVSDSVNNGGNWQKTLRLACVYAEADI